MNYACVTGRFLFFNGIKRYTVEFHYGASTWYIFEDEKQTGALWYKKIKPSQHRSPNRDEAAKMLYEFLETLPLANG